eukprot:667162_1
MSLSAFNIWQRKYGIHSFKYLLIILTFIGICFLCYQNRILTSSESIFKHIEYRLANDTESRSPSLQPSNDSYNTNISFISAQYMKRMQKTPKSSMVTLGIPIHFQKANIGIFQLQRSLCMHIFGSWMLPKAIYLTLTNLKSAFGSNATILLFRAHANNLFHQIEQITQIKINVFYEYKKVKTPHNRNILSQQSFNDHKDAFLSMFDADDIAHPQRLEIIDYFYRLRIPKKSIQTLWFYIDLRIESAGKWMKRTLLLIKILLVWMMSITFYSNVQCLQIMQSFTEKAARY